METRPILIDIPEKLVGKNMIVRPYRAGDGKALFDAVDESREHILPWMPWGPGHGSSEDSEALVRQFSAKWILREDMPAGMWTLGETEYLGGTGLHRINWGVRSFEIGYWIKKSAEGKGFVTESVRLLTELAFETLEANRVYIRCAMANSRSAAVALRNGFVQEGIEHNGIKDADGKLHDLIVFSLVPTTYRLLKDGK